MSQLRWLLVGLVALGVSGFALGLVGDLQGWWGGLGYTSNVLAGLTGAFFGIPFAVAVLQRVLRDDNVDVAARADAGGEISPPTTRRAATEDASCTHREDH